MEDVDYLSGREWFNFSSQTKYEAKQRAGGRCEACGDKTNALEVHHRVPQCVGGSDDVENAVVLCGHRADKIGQSCHQWWDEHTLKTGEIYPGIDPHVVLNERPYMFKSSGRFEDFLHAIGKL